ncbi:MAG: hypothetical protein IJD30_01665 [Clostridia bacterium]|nr:hypothetical protein [Clostridia bacterium]
MNEKLEEIFYAVIAVVVIWLIIRFVYINVSMFFARLTVNKAPTQENAMRVFRLLNKRLGVSINNHPKEWAKYRDMFYIINGSAEVPSELKERIKTRLIKKGLYINNMKIIDNYKAVNSGKNGI